MSRLNEPGENPGAEADEAPHRRPIRSYVLREGRMTEGQRRAFETLWPRFGINFTPGAALDFPALFGNNHPVYLEIGFGNGDALLHAAEAHPERNYVGIEVHRPGVGHLLNSLQDRGMENVRVMRHDASEVLTQGLKPGSLSGIALFFPDPWHKKKHHKRRIVQPEFVRLAARALATGGILHMATDWDDYAQHMLSTVESSGLFTNLAGPGQFSPRPEDRLLTRFERRGHRLGHGVWDLLFERKA